ncbi:hypothetical protein [Streptomyces mirabilis]|uniref:hypothetical protein n=1 Tax=Streptomyces mirabilis TaxID=68239 RepID=UPI00365D0320
MIPAAALAIVRAVVEDAQRLRLDRAEDVAEQVVAELTAHGWTIVRDTAGPEPAASA